MMRRLGIVCIAVGVLLLCASLGLLCYNTWESRSAMEASDSVLTQIREEARVETPGAEDPYEDRVAAFDETAKEMTVKQIDGYDYIGYLSIPAFELELPVMSEWDYPRLKIAPCRQYGSTKTDDLVIAAHNYPSHFGSLSRLLAGDLLTFTDMDGDVVLYEVVGIEILEPTQVEAVKNSDFDLVLYTCTYGGENRVAAFCSRVRR